MGLLLPGARVPQRRRRATVSSTETTAAATAAHARYQPENSLAARGFVIVETVLPVAALQRPFHHKIKVRDRFPGAGVQHRRVPARARVLVAFGPDADQLGIGDFLTFRRRGKGEGGHELWHGKRALEIFRELLFLLHRGSTMDFDFLCQFLLLLQ